MAGALNAATEAASRRAAPQANSPGLMQVHAPVLPEKVELTTSTFELLKTSV